VGALRETEAVRDISTVRIVSQSRAAGLAGRDAFLVPGDGGGGADEGEIDGFGEVHCGCVGLECWGWCRKFSGIDVGGGCMVERVGG